MRISQDRLFVSARIVMIYSAVYIHSMADMRYKFHKEISIHNLNFVF